VSDIKVIFHCKKHGILKCSDVIALNGGYICGLCFNSQPAEVQGDGQAHRTTLPAQNIDLKTGVININNLHGSDQCNGTEVPAQLLLSPIR